MEILPNDIVHGFNFHSIDVNNTEELNKLYLFLNNNYAEDNNGLFRLGYSKEFLHWALTFPGYIQDLQLTLQNDNKEIIAFISAIPVNIVNNEAQARIAEVNFLCIDKKYRNKNFTPTLVKELTRRCNYNGINKSIFISDHISTNPTVKCQYYHRALNPRKLTETGFINTTKTLTLQRMIRLYSLPDKTTTPGLRPLCDNDISQACELVNNYLKQFKLHPHFTEQEFAQRFTPRDNIMYCYVVEDPNTHLITDVVSFYAATLTVLNNNKHQYIKLAYLWYTAITKTNLKQLINDVLIIANQHHFDNFICLQQQHNDIFISDLKFKEGTSSAKYYVDNFNNSSIQLKSNEVGLILV